MNVESLLLQRIHAKSFRYDKIRGLRTAYTVAAGNKRPDYLVVPGDLELVEGQQIHVVRWKPGSSTIVALLKGGHGTPIHIEPMSRFGLISFALINNTLAVWSFVISDAVAAYVIAGTGWAVVNGILLYSLLARRKLAAALRALRDFQQQRLALGFRP